MSGKKRTYVAYALSVALAAAMVQCVSIKQADCQPRITAASNVGEGLNTTVFQTPSGKINVNLPEDMAASDTLSGTVIADPVGANQDELAKASDELNGYVVEIQKVKEAPPLTPVAETTEDHPKKTKEKPTPISCSPTEPGFTCALPPVPEPIKIVLIDKKTKKPVCTNEVTYPKDPPSDSCPGDGSCMIPETGQCNHPIDVKTKCNGHSDGCGINVGGTDCQTLACGPRDIIAKSPKNIVGSTEIKVKNGNKVAKSTFRNISVKLTSPKTVLKKGESTTVTVTVYGLGGCDQPVVLTLKNRTPQTVQMEGGNDQQITINPQQL